ncbi:MAG: helix-turn-helix transcriptional regulator, partial [Candidatus Hydrothermarchaeaceae archaeon]
EFGPPIPTELREFRAILLFERLIEEQPSEQPSIVVVREEPPEPISNREVLPYAVIGVLVLILIPLAWHYLREEGITIADYFDKRRIIEKKIDILREDEQSILKLVVENDGIDQRDIQRTTGFSKTKVSKILSELEKRDAITKQQIGRRNKIYLSSKMKEVQ